MNLSLAGHVLKLKRNSINSLKIDNFYGGRGMSGHHDPTEYEERDDSCIAENHGEDTLMNEVENQVKQAPIWFVSIAFHVCIILVLNLIIFGLPVKKRPNLCVTGKIIQEPEKPPVRRPDRELQNRKSVMPELSDLKLPPVVVDEDDPKADHMETDDNLDFKSAQGDEESISNIPLSNRGIVATIGLFGSSGGTLGNRIGGGRKQSVLGGGGTRGSESAVRSSLRWLARHQELDGRWDCRKYGGTRDAAQGDPAVTGMALLAFLGAGYTENHGRFKDNVKRGVEWLIHNQKENGQWGQRNYEHGICLMAIAESVGMGGSSATRESALRGIDYCLSQQNPSGCWNYTRSATRDDLSVTGWNIMGLKSALVAGLKPQRIRSAFRKCGAFFDKQKETTGDTASDTNGMAWYTPQRNRGGNGQKGDACVAIAMLCRQFMGWKKNNMWLQAAADNQTAKIPNWGNRNVYRIYYASLTLFQMGDPHFKKWNQPVRDMIIENQRAGDPSIDGSWDYDSKYCTHGGRVMSTALLCLCLEVYYRYKEIYRS